MFTFLFALLACAPQTTEPLATEALRPTVEVTAPSPWYYADEGDGIDWSSLRREGADLAFRTIGHGLQSGPLADDVAEVAGLVCGTATHLSLAFRDGRLAEVLSVPEAPCVTAAAAAADWSRLLVGERPLASAEHAVLVFDVPAQASM